MKNECNVARDLMPLVIDGVASEESQSFVDTHVVECEECAGVYADMCGELEQQRIVQLEQAELEAAAKEVRAKRLRKGILYGVMVVLLAVVIFLTAYHADEIAFRARYVHLNGDLKAEALFVRVACNYYGDAMRCVVLTSAPSGYPKFRMVVGTELIEDGAAVCMYYGAKYATRDPENDEYDAGGISYMGMVEDDVWVMYSEDAHAWLPVHRIELRTGNEVQVLWNLGDEVPTTADALEEEKAAQLTEKQ